MKNLENDEIIIHQGKRHFLEIVLGSIFYATIIFVLIFAIFNFLINGNFKVFLWKIHNILILIGLLFPLALSFTVTKSIIINPVREKLISIYSVGVFSKKIESKIPKLNYISIFKNSKDEFEVNLWYSNNKHYKMYNFEKFEEALLFGKHLSKKLHIDLLDATKKGNFKWIEIED